MIGTATSAVADTVLRSQKLRKGSKLHHRLSRCVEEGRSANYGSCRGVE